MPERHIAYSHLGLLQDPAYIRYDNKINLWSANDGALNHLYCVIANAGADCQRILPWGVWEKHPYGMRSQFSPYKLAGDPGQEKFDLSLFNSYYFPIVKKAISIAKSFGIKTWFCLADNCQFHGGYRKYSPWFNNVNGITSIYDKKAYIYFRAWINRCLKEFDGLDVGWSWGNEMNNKAFPELAKTVLFPYIKNNKFNASNCTLGATLPEAPYVSGAYDDSKISVQDYVKKDVGVAFGDDIKKAIWRECHGIGHEGYPKLPNYLDQILSWWGNHPIKVWLSDDGVYDGDSKCDTWIWSGKVQTRPSGSRWASMVKLAKKYRNSFIFEHTPKNAANLDCQVSAIKFIYYALYGKYPASKYHCI